jgi:NTP pyrophosphatase (non-canonical NTP hydrolase)
LTPRVYVTRAIKDTASIDDYAADIQEIWPRDKTRPILQHWLNVVAHASVLAEEIRKSSWDKVAHETAEVFVWWLSFVMRISLPPENNSDAIFYLPCKPSEIVWSKFPNRCPVCFGLILSQIINISPASEEGFSSVTVENAHLIEAYTSLKDKKCSCLIEKELIEKRSKSFKYFVKSQLDRLSKLEELREDKPTSLKRLEASLENIYEPPIFVLSASEIAFHLLEEIGEVSEALVSLTMQPTDTGTDFLNEHKKRLRNLREELADVFSWTIAMRARTHFILSRATAYVKDAYKEGEGLEKEVGEKFVSKLLEPTSNIVGLLWKIYASGNSNELRCEECGERECNPEHENHKKDSGHLYGEEVKKFFDQISSLQTCADLSEAIT